MIDVANIIDTIIYPNDEAKKELYRKCIEYVINSNDEFKSFSVEEIEHLLNNPIKTSLSNKAIASFYSNLRIDEGDKLFEIACQKYGYKLWNGNAWHNKTCKRTCPLADFCRKYTVDINGERLCRGQIYSREISWKELPEDTQIYKQDGSPYITQKQDYQSFGEFFSFSLDIYFFGGSKRGGTQMLGGNVIMKLYKEALKEKSEAHDKSSE